MSRAPDGRRLSPLGAITRGLVAGAVGSVALDLVWFAGYKRAGGEQSFWAWETGADVKKWDDVIIKAGIEKK